MSQSPVPAGNDSVQELLSLLQLMRRLERPQKPCKSITDAVTRDDVEMVKKFLAMGADVNERLGALAAPASPARILSLC